MKIPPGKTEEEVLDAIERAVNLLAPRFVFGPYTKDDIKQQGRLYALELLEKEVYDPAKPIENFLYTHIKNRLLNLVRDRLRRNDAPCKKCHGGEPCGPDGKNCNKYAVWLANNQAKSNLLKPCCLDRVADEQEKRIRTESSIVVDAEINECLERLDTQLPAEMREDYLRMRDGVHVAKSRRRQIEDKVKEIFGGSF